MVWTKQQNLDVTVLEKVYSVILLCRAPAASLKSGVKLLMDFSLGRLAKTVRCLTQWLLNEALWKKFLLSHRVLLEDFLLFKKLILVQF